MSKHKSCVKSYSSHETVKPPNPLSEYLAQENNRFAELYIYFDGLCIDDVKYLKPHDLISIVPYDRYRHRLLMTIFVRRYLFRECDVSSDEESHTTC